MRKLNTSFKKSATLKKRIYTPDDLVSSENCKFFPIRLCPVKAAVPLSERCITKDDLKGIPAVTLVLRLKELTALPEAGSGEPSLD